MWRWRYDHDGLPCMSSTGEPSAGPSSTWWNRRTVPSSAVTSRFGSNGTVYDLLKAARPNDRPPLYCLNQVGVPKRPEISAGEFAKAIESQPIVAIPFEPQMFGSAANNGQMIAEIAAGHKTTEMFLQIAQRLSLAHGRWLVDQALDHGHALFSQAA